MSVKSVCLALMFDERHQDHAAIDYAVDFAAANKAHLTVTVGLPEIVIPVEYPAASLMQIQAEEDGRRLKLAEAWGESVRNRASVGGATTTLDLNQDVLGPLLDNFNAAARVHDYAVTKAPRTADEFQSDVVQELVLTSGAPVIMVPADWKGGAKFNTIVVAWDGSAPAARAVRDALPLLKMATTVEIVSVVGEKGLPKDFSANAIGAQLSRHCKGVKLTELKSVQGSVYDAIQNQATLVRADLVVMGGYGHSRLREWIMGGVTQQTLSQTKVPVLLAH